MNRRNFLFSMAAATCTMPVGRATCGTAKPAEAAAKRVPPRNRHPYAGVDWDKALQINGTTHVHCTSQKQLDIILKRGIEFLTLSNYYPSAPWWPLAKMTRNYFRLHHDFPVMVNGRLQNGPFDWNKIVGGWIKELPEEMQAEYPFKEGEKLFKPLPANVLEAPNAEHHHFTHPDGRYAACLHMNAPGSAFASGTFDIATNARFRTRQHGYSNGCSETWQAAIDHMLDGLIHPDGGGVTVNHPNWSALRRDFILDILDYDPRVLGMEVVEGGAASREFYWDWVLATGRQCFGFFVPDHEISRRDGNFGVNVLLVPERSVHACLVAYRQGNFYGALRGLGELRFKRIAFSGGDTVEAETDRPARLEVVTARGVVKCVEKGASIKWKMEKPNECGGSRRHANAFIRVKAHALDGSGEVLFSQPYMLEDPPSLA